MPLPEWRQHFARPEHVDPRTELSRHFEYDYIFWDACFGAVWLACLFKGGHRFALVYGVVLAGFIYTVDENWFFTPASGFSDGVMIREYEFTLTNGTLLTRQRDAPDPYPWGYAASSMSNLYVLLKHGSDYMMRTNYSFVFNGWWVVVMQAWRDRRRSELLAHRVLPYTAAFFCGIAGLVPLLSYLLPLCDIKVWTVRHMSGEPDMTNDLIRWKTWIGFTLMSLLYARRDPLAVPYVFVCGMIQALTMEVGLFCFGIRPFSYEILWHETLYLINQGTAFVFTAIDIVLPLLGTRTDPASLDEASLSRLAAVTVGALGVGGTASKLGGDVGELLLSSPGPARHAAVLANVWRHAATLTGAVAVVAAAGAAAAGRKAKRQ